MKKIILIGSNGQIGGYLKQHLLSCGSVINCDRAMLDLQYSGEIKKVIREIKPDIIVNAAAYTDVERAEIDVDTCMAINAVAPAVLAEEANRQKALFIQYSTDYVFDGQESYYSENSTTNPLNAYGHSKLAGEKAITAIANHFYILRTSWIYGKSGKNFFNTLFKLARGKAELRIIMDQIGSPTLAEVVAESTKVLLQNEKSKDRKFSGIYHMSSQDETSWYLFAKAIFAHYQKIYPDFIVPKLVPITSSEYKSAAIRPKNSTLNTGKLQEIFSIQLSDWETALKKFLKRKLQNFLLKN